MKTPAQYQFEFEELTKQGASSPEKLVELERNLQLDIRALEVQFKGRSVSSLNRINKQTGREKAEGQKRLEDEKQSKLQPYHDLLKKVQEKISAE